MEIGARIEEAGRRIKSAVFGKPLPLQQPPEDVVLPKPLPNELQSGRNLRFPNSPWRHLRPDVKEGPLKNAIGGNGGESLFNAFLDGVVSKEDYLTVDYLAQGNNRRKLRDITDLFYLGPSNPIFDPKGKDPRPSHVFYSPTNNTVFKTGAILTWTKFPSARVLPEKGKTAIDNFFKLKRRPIPEKTEKPSQ